MKINIRSVKENDYNCIARLYKELHKDKDKNKSEYYKESKDVFNKEYLKKYLENSDMDIFVAVNEKENIVGALEYEIRSTAESEELRSKKILFINSLVIDINYRKNGIAKELFDYIVDRSKRVAIDAIELSVQKFDSDEIGLYESLTIDIKNELLK